MKLYNRDNLAVPLPGLREKENQLRQSSSQATPRTRSLGCHKNMNSTAIKAIPLPNRKGALGLKPRQGPTPCHKTPAINDVGKNNKPMIAL
jgi:hypothetical protein